MCGHSQKHDEELSYHPVRIHCSVKTVIQSKERERVCVCVYVCTWEGGGGGERGRVGECYRIQTN